jgi:hypothetical protein
MAFSTPISAAFGTAESGLQRPSRLRTLSYDSGHPSRATLDRALAGDITYSP